jgi:hypothetical protein
MRITLARIFVPLLLGLLPLAACGEDAGSGGSAATCDTAGLDCTALASKRAEVESEYTSELTQGHFDALPPIGACSQKVVRAQISAAGSCGLTRCGEICRLHPCSELPQATCEEKCAEQAMPLSEAQLDAILDGAALTPGVCSCDICDQGSFTFCQAMWACSQG